MSSSTPIDVSPDGTAPATVPAPTAPVSNAADARTGALSNSNSHGGEAPTPAAVPTASSAPTAPPADAPPQPPLEDQEMLAFGTVAEHEILPPAPRDPNAPLNGQADANGNGEGSPAANGVNGTKRSMGTGAAGAPLARAKRPKNVKFSPAKVGKQLARRAAAPGAGGGEVVLANNDYCDSCGGKGHFLCCEGGCLRSFHFGCLEPPLEIDEVPEESWFCKACRAKANPPPRLPPGFFSELISNVDKENPKAFQLSQELRQFYKNVAVGLNGEFIDSTEHRPPSRITGRAVGQEDRDGYRLKDKNGRPIICYSCSQAANPHIHRRIISCDFCDQHWHLDCLNPPMTGMPPPTRKWMCPVHSEHVLPKKRVPRQTTVVNIEETGLPNNGDIIVQPTPDRAPPEEYEEMTVNRIRYQVPEQNIILDFWAKVVPPSRRTVEGAKKSKRRTSPRKKRAAGNGYESGNSSPLTDLTSSDEDEDVEMADSRPPMTTTTNSRSTSGGSASPLTLLDNLALLAEVRYIDLLNQNSDVTSPRSGSRPPPGPGSPAQAVASTSSSGTPRGSTIPSIPPSSAGVASPTLGTAPLVGGVTHAAGRNASPSLSPAPVSSSSSSSVLKGGSGPASSSELTVQSKEDLKALMQVRKLLLSQGQAQGSTTKTTMLSFLEGAPIIPKLAFVNNGKSASWQRPWEAKKDGPRASSGPAPPPTVEPQSSSASSANSPKPAVVASLPVPDAIAAAKSSAAASSSSSSNVATTSSPVVKVEEGGGGGLPSQRQSQRASTLSSKRDVTPVSATMTTSTLPAPSPSSSSSSSTSKTTRPSAAAAAGSPVLSSSSSNLIPTPYSSDMPFQLPAFRPPSATPVPETSKSTPAAAAAATSTATPTGTTQVVSSSSQTSQTNGTN